MLKIKEKIRKIIRLKYLPAILLAFVVILQLANITNTIVDQKKGYHSDEIFSYGLANGFYEPFIHADYIYQAEYKNVDEWVSGDVLRHYITVQPGEQFRYDSVWYNQSQDRHPPLFYTVLHTICSFFPDTFSPVFGYIINYICFVVMQIFLYKLARNMLKSKYLAVLVCALWGFSAGAIDLTIFIRMYCMVTMWTVIFMYLHSELYRRKDPVGVKMYISLAVVTACGALTQYLFFFVAFVTAVFFCIYYLAKKQMKSFLKYGFSVLGGVVLEIIVFPYTIKHFFFDPMEKMSVDFPKQLNLLSNYILRDILGIKGSEHIFLIHALPGLVLIAVIFSIPILFLLRDKPFVKNFFSGLRNIRNFRIKKVFAAIWHDIQKIHPLFYVCLISVLTISCITAYQISFFEMMYVSRYVFVIYPLVVVLIVYLLYFILTRCKIRKIILSVCIAAMTIYTFYSNPVTFLFDGQRTVDNLGALTAESECVFIEPSYNQTWLIDTLPIDLYQVNHVFVTYIDNSEETKKNLSKIKTDKKVYLFINKACVIADDNEKTIIYEDEKTKKAASMNFDDYIDQYKKLSYVTKFENVGIYTIFERTYDIYQLA
ncbi:MAG: hypothetical protein IJ192_02680 [Clostridia bacterium]|nr:hypothetical protein [Clostridia bacterium]